MASIGPGMVIADRYALERRLGVGGMATVWLADDRLLGRKVAVKILSDRYASDPGFVERFRREASAAASLSHTNIVAVYDRGEASGSYYIVMEYLPGPDLKAIIREHGRLEPRHAVDGALQILAALGAAHRRDLIHRDIKPQNVIVSGDGQLKVTDFGIARAGDEADMTDAGSVIGTAQYLSPEQARGDEVTAASDCYAVGIVLYEMLTGRVPFDGDKPVAVAMRQVNEAPIAPKLLEPSIPDELNTLVMKALEKRPSNRFRTAEEFSQALLAIRPTLPSPAQTTQVMPAVDHATQVLPATPPAAAQEPRATRTVVQSGRPPASQPELEPRRRGIIVAAVLAALVLVGVLAAFLFTDIGRGGVVVPSVAGDAPEAARATLISAGLTVDNEVESRADATVPTGFVVGTDPEEGASVDRGTVVTLIVSTGPELKTVPDVGNLTRKQAAEKLEAEGFVPVFSEDFSEDVKKGLVMQQTPAAGQQLGVGGTVNVVLSKGADLVAVPNIKLMSVDEAEAALTKAGLELGVRSERTTTQRDPETVLDQAPAAGTKVARGSAVNYTVAVAPATIEMPPLVGMSADEARAKLVSLGFPDPISDVDYSDTVAEGDVMGQDPAAGTQIDPSQRNVVIIVSLGPEPTLTSP